MTKQLRYAILTLLCIVTLSCANEIFAPEPKHPSREEVLALAILDKPTPEFKFPFSLYITPRTALAGITFRLTCLLPSGKSGRFRFGIEGYSVSEGDIDRREHSMLFTICDSQTAFCNLMVKEPGKAIVTETRTLLIEPAGECR